MTGQQIDFHAPRGTIFSLLLIGAFELANTNLGVLAQNQSMQQEILNAHNQYRAQVHVPPLIWSNSLAGEAKNYANYLASHRSFQHSGTQGEGENLWKGTSRRYSFTQMIGSWGNEKQFYNGGVITTSNYGKFGHYTQMVWRKTTQVGCGGTDGSDGNYVLVCRYVSPGNVIGQTAY